MAKGRICYIAPHQIHSYRWIKAFFQMGYDISLIADSRAWISPRIEFIPVYTLPSLNQRNFPQQLIANAFAIMKILKKVNPDFVHLHVQHYYSPVIVLSGFLFILTSWGIEVLRLPTTNFLRKTLARYAAAKAREITVDAKCLKDIWVKIGISQEKIRVIPFGVDTNIFSPDVDGRPIRKKLEIGEDDVAVISTRPFYNDHYNLESLIRAIPLILRKHKNVTFIIKGAGPLEGYLKSLAKKLNVSEHVRFAGLVPYYEVARYLAASDIYVSTSFVDSTSVSLLEAMACGLAPLVTNISGNREWIKDGVNGFLFTPRSPTALAEKATILIENPSLRKRFGKRCINIVEQRATWEKCISEMEAIYKLLM